MIEMMRAMPENFSMREKAFMLEALMKTSDEATTELPLVHHFGAGLYARELHIPRGMITVGKVHKYSCLNILAKGERSTLVGDEIKRIKAPYIYVSEAGIKRVSYTHQDAIWITVHATDETDVARLEEMLVATSEAEYQDFLRLAKGQQPCLS